MNMVLHPSAIRSPLKSLWNWLTDSSQTVTVYRPTAQLQQCSAAAPNHAMARQVVSQHAAPIRVMAQATRSSPRPLRTLRVMEVGQAPGQVGRMVMSGRMADVCAELDRLVAREARLH
jgi:hypothetical protein